MISIVEMDKAEVLAALYNRAKPQGMGFLHYEPKDMSTDEAAEILAGQQRFDYLKGRVMKVDLSGDKFDPRLYDRDNGDGAAERVVVALRSGSAPARCRDPLGVPSTCTMPEPLLTMIATVEAAAGRRACWGCNEDRSVCHGESKR
jgi:hypothetical protein